MYKVVLVDDEALVREAISENIKWNQLGYELVATCKNGKEAMEFIKNDPPDLLLTDICMPYMDGMELTKFVHETYPDMKVIIFSGYDEFEYAKKAVKYRVVEYVLKPVTAYELSEILMKLKQDFDDEYMKQANMKKLKGAYQKNLPVLRSRFLNQLIESKHKDKTEHEIQEELEQLAIGLHGRQYQVAVIDGQGVDDFLKDSPNLKQDLPSFILFNIMEELINENDFGIAFQDINNYTILVFCGERGQLDQKITETYGHGSEILRRFYELGMTMGVGSAVDSLQKLSNSYQSALSALEYRFLFGENKLLDIRDFVKLKNETSIDISGLVSKLILETKINNQTEIKSNLVVIMDSIRQAGLSKNRTYLYVQNIIVAIDHLIETMEIEEKSSLEISKEQEQLIQMLSQQKTLKDIQEAMERFCLIIGDRLSDQRDSFSKKQALLAVDYIEKNYADSEVTLQTVCSKLSISTSYFSSIFKSHTGETFIEALTKKRMNQAKELLLNTSLKNYEIAERVGFNDPHYFSITFKKFTGMTPKEFAKESR